MYVVGVCNRWGRKLAKKSLSRYFQEPLYNQFGERGFIQWTADKSGTTASFSDLTMTAKDWANFGQFSLTQKREDICLREFFTGGVNKSMNTGKKNRWNMAINLGFSIFIANPIWYCRGIEDNS